MHKNFFLMLVSLSMLSTTALFGRLNRIRRYTVKHNYKLPIKTSSSDFLQKRASYPHIYTVTIPKSGSHLVTGCLDYLTGRHADWHNNNFLAIDKTKRFSAGHIFHSDPSIEILKQHNYKAIFVYRDPRDILVSTAYWIQNKLEYYPDFVDIKDDLSAIIDRLLSPAGDKHTWNCYKDYLPFTNDKFFLKVKFEDLVGPKGGGSKAAQVATIKRIAAHVGVPFNGKLIDYCADNLFGKPGTFRKGIIGGWKKELTADQKKRASIRLGHAIRQFGYAF